MKAQGLKRQLAVWLVGVLSTLLAVDAWFSYSDALGAANHAYDRSLSASVKGIAERIYATESEIVVDIPYSALELFEAGSSDRLFYSVGTPGEKEITGYEGLPVPEHIEPNAPFSMTASSKASNCALAPCSSRSIAQSSQSRSWSSSVKRSIPGRKSCNASFCGKWRARRCSLSSRWRLRCWRQ